jgi:hypothetical protein
MGRKKAYLIHIPQMTIYLHSLDDVLMKKWVDQHPTGSEEDIGLVHVAITQKLALHWNNNAPTMG